MRRRMNFVQHLGGNVLLLGPLSSYVDESLKGAADFQPTSFDKAILVNLGRIGKFYPPRVLTMRGKTAPYSAWCWPCRT